MTSLNIVDLITNNPITKLTETHNINLLNKVKNTFNESEQQLFIASFYSYLNYHKTDDYIVDLDNIWQWLGFNQKVKAKYLLEKNFELEKDYKKSLSLVGKQTNIEITNKKTKGGQNIQKYYLNIKTFKSLCLKAQTKKADEIHEYYIKLEELIQEVLEEEASEMKNKLLIKENQLNEKEELISQKDNIIKNANQDKYKTIEKTLVSQFPVNNECIYFGTIDNTNEKGEKLIKFGHSNNLPLRVQDHHKNYDNFILRDVFKVHNRQEIENAIKSHPKIKSHIRSIEVNGKNKNEILSYDSTYFTINRLSKYIKDIISEKTYSIEKFNKILEENSNLKKENEELYNLNHNLEEINNSLQLELNEMREKNNNIEKSYNLLKEDQEITIKSEINYNNSLIDNTENNKRFAKFIEECCILHSEAEVYSADIIGQFRIWNKVKPKKETFQDLNKYLRTRFYACRLNSQIKNQCVHGFRGIKLKHIYYKKSYIDSNIENFIFENCIFSPDGRCSTNKVFDELIKYKEKLNLEINKNELEDLKFYLNNCDYVVKGTIHLHNDNFSYEGYYGVSLKSDSNNIRIGKSITSKKVCKIDLQTNNILNTWESIVKASMHENISASKMSRSIKNEVKYDNYYYKILE
uniref:MSV199 domain-containing protein n=1 Tax=Nucleocytoviricota sp. TaxID=2809609 RepID=A0A9E8G4Z6_9VIRU|nr:hypothetical protein [Nucleocytoviricota sp.]UZT29139.1 hypothetical protein [Nucleocytoviricota sp.]